MEQHEIDNLIAQVQSLGVMRDQANNRIHELQTDFLIKEKAFKDLNNQIQGLLKEKEEMKKELEELKKVLANHLPEGAC